MVLLKLLRVDSSAIEALAISRRATAILRNPRLGDEVKERMARRYSFRLLARFFCIAFPTAIAGAGGFSVLVLMDALDIATLPGTLAVLSDWGFAALVLAVSLAALIVFAFYRMRRRTRHEV